MNYRSQMASIFKFEEIIFFDENRQFRKNKLLFLTSIYFYYRIIYSCKMGLSNQYQKYYRYLPTSIIFWESIYL